MPSKTLPAPDRRRLMALAALAALGGSMFAGRTRAAATTSKADVKYQYMPKGAAHCGACASFIPPPNGGGGPGTCRIVEGPIPQNGWCVLFAPR